MVLCLWLLAFLANHVIASSATDPQSESTRGSSQFWCPAGCVCSAPARIVDCSSRRLATVPDVPRITTRLYLHDNLIHTLVSQQFKSLRHLIYLILATNVISEVQPEAFAGLHSLKYLILDSNNISQLPHGVFKGLKHLETVSLAKNQLEVLPNGLFPHSKQLTMINLQGNSLHTIQSGAFSGLQDLHTLNLEDNHLDQRVFQELANTKKRLAILRLNGNRIVSLPQNGLDLPTLKTLSLHSNNISEIPRPLLLNCSALKSLSLNNNNLKTLTSNVLSDCRSLLKLELGNNQLAELHPDVFKDLIGLVNLFLHRNLLTSLPIGVFSNLHSVEGIYLSNNRLKVIPRGVFEELPSLVTIRLEWNELSVIEKATFVNMTRLETVFLHHNNLTDIQPGAFINLPNLKHLVIYENHLTVLKQGVLNSLNSLQKIHMDPLQCSCMLAPLASWVRRHHVRGLMCVGRAGSLIAVANLEEECRTPVKKIMPDARERTTHVPTEQDTGHKASGGPKDQMVGESDAGKPDHPSDAMNLVSAVEHLQQSVSELQFRVSRLESALSDSHICQRWVCLHKGTRLEPGDQWREDKQICSCLPDGVMECTAMK